MLLYLAQAPALPSTLEIFKVPGYLVDGIPHELLLAFDNSSDFELSSLGVDTHPLAAVVDLSCGRKPIDMRASLVLVDGAEVSLEEALTEPILGASRPRRGLNACLLGMTDTLPMAA